MASSTSSTTSLGGMARRGLGVGRVIDARNMHGCVVCHRGGIDNMPEKVIALITPEDGLAEDDNNGF